MFINNEIVMFLSDKYNEFDFQDIIFAEHQQHDTDSHFCCIEHSNVAYILLYYVLIFFTDQSDWTWSLCLENEHESCV